MAKNPISTTQTDRPVLRQEGSEEKVPKTQNDVKRIIAIFDEIYYNTVLSLREAIVKIRLVDA